MKLLALPFVIVAALIAQVGNIAVKFEVVSIKPNNSGSTDWKLRGLGDAGGRLSASNVDLRFLILAGYGDPNPMLLGNDSTEITGLPGWAKTARYDVEAQPTAGLNPTPVQRQGMVRSMLADRFKLVMRVERKNRPTYSLVVDNGGVKMKRYVAPAPGAAPAQLPRSAAPKGARQFRLLRADMPAITGFLTSQAGRKVVDKTGLTGFYEVDLTYAPNLPQGPDADPNITSLSTALREQMGLRLVPETGPVDTFVVESVQKPSEN